MISLFYNSIFRSLLSTDIKFSVTFVYEIIYYTHASRYYKFITNQILPDIKAQEFAFPTTSDASYIHLLY